MTTHRFLLLTVLGLSLPGPALAVDETRPEGTILEPGRVEVPMDIHTGRPLVELRINGSGPYAFILDTGASLSVIDRDVAAELELPVVGETTFGDPTAPEAFTSTLVRAESVDVGGLRLTGMTLTTFALREMMGAGPAGVLGFPDLAEVLVTIDSPRQRVCFARGELPADDARVVPYACEGSLISLPMTVAAESITAHLDSGNPGMFMLPKARQGDWNLESEPVEVGIVGTVGSTAKVWNARVDGTITLAGLVFEDPEVAISGLLTDWANVGFNALAGVELTVDQKNRRLRMIRSDTPAEARPSRRLVGVMFMGMGRPGDGLSIRDEGLQVANVVPGSLAEQAGIRRGDVIFAVNGRPVGTYGSDDLGRLFGGQDRLDFDIRRDGEVLTAFIE